MWDLVWADRALALRLLGLMDACDLPQLQLVNNQCRKCIYREMKRFRCSSARLGLALWVLDHVELEFQSYYQELETHQISRSAERDPRVPPHVVSFWAERGKVPNGVVALRPHPLPKRNERGFALKFVAARDQSPMLTSVVQTNRRIYTVVTLWITKRSANGTQRQESDGEDKAILLRRLWYLREYGEWRAMVPATNKRRLDDHGALCRYDLVSHDGSVALELDVPRGADSMMDYYLVKRATVFVPLEELLHPFVKKLRPPRELSLDCHSSPRRCRVVVSFGRMDGTIYATHELLGDLTLEQQSQTPPHHNTDDATTDSAPSVAEPLRARTGIESFDIVTVKSSQATAPIPIVELPADPGYLWMTIIDDDAPRSSSVKRPYYYTTAMLHNGVSGSRAVLTLNAQWVPGTLESFPTPQFRRRRTLKGFFRLSTDMDTHELTDMNIVAQHLPRARLEPYAASIESYTRPV